jgi:hypothetical protein
MIISAGGGGVALMGGGMVLGAQLMIKTTNKSRTYFQRVTVTL